MKNYLLILLLICSPYLYAQTTLEELVKNGSVKIEAKSLGNHDGECIQIRVSNLLKQTLTFSIEPGYEFISDDSTMQDILIVDNKKFTLPAAATRVANLIGYCCRLSRASPAENASFTWGGKKRSNLVAMADFLVNNNLKDSPSAQGAVWAVSDGQPISSLWDDSHSELSRKLIEFAANLTKQKVPWYRAKFTEITPGPQVFQTPMEMLNIKADWEFKIAADDQISFAVYDKTGVKVREFYTDKAFAGGRYVYTFAFETNKLPKGKYTFKMTGKNNGLIKEEVLDL